jgi:ATP-dependent DNA ligase
MAARSEARRFPHPRPQTRRARPGLEPERRGFFPAIVEAVRRLDVNWALIDGKAVVLRNDGRSSFLALLTKRGGAQATLVAFDLLPLNSGDLRLRPLEARREAALKRLVDDAAGIVGVVSPSSRGCCRGYK